MSVDGKTGRVDDNNDAAIAVPETTYLTQAIAWATARVNFFCLGNYEAVDLATSYLVNQWALIIAAHWLSIRRGNPAPGSWKDLYEETIADLKLIKAGTYQIPDLGYRSAMWPAWSNVNVNVGYALKKVRVERPISESGPSGNPPYRQHRDLQADYIFEP